MIVPWAIRLMSQHQKFIPLLLKSDHFARIIQQCYSQTSGTPIAPKPYTFCLILLGIQNAIYSHLLSTVTRIVDGYYFGKFSEPLIQYEQVHTSSNQSPCQCPNDTYYGYIRSQSQSGGPHCLDSQRGCLRSSYGRPASPLTGLARPAFVSSRFDYVYATVFLRAISR